MKIQECSYKTIQSIFPIDEMKREGLVFCKKAKMYICYVNEVAIGMFALIEYKNKFIVKNIYIFPEYRRQGLFREMFVHIERATAKKPVEATCTHKSIDLFMSKGFKVVKEFSKYKKVRRENIS